MSRHKQPWVAHHRMDARRELPWVPIGKEYRFDTEDGSRTLRESFGGRSQLIVYHFTFGPTYTRGLPGLLVGSRHLQRRRTPPERARRDVLLHLPGAAGETPGLQAADGVDFPWAPRMESTTTSTSRSHARRRRSANS